MPRVVFVLLVLAAYVVGACGGEPEDPGPQVTPPPGVTPVASLGKPEGRLRLLAPPGFADHTAPPGCRAEVEVAETPEALVRRFAAGGYDGVLGNGDVTVRLLADGAIAPINTELVSNYEEVYEGLKERPFNSVDGQMFALPVGRSANMLVWRRNSIPGTVGSLGTLLDPPQVAALGEQITVPDDPASIAEAALWVSRRRDDLEITDPYELDRRQFDAVMEILHLQEPYVSGYWTDAREVATAFRTGSASAGMARQAVVGDLQRRPGPGGPIEATRPREGSTGESPAWMLAADAEHPNCMYAWMNEALAPRTQADLAQAVSIAPANGQACELIPDHCQLFRADDDGFYRRVLFRTYPSADCGDERGRVCTEWEDWVRAWQELRQSG